MYLASYVGSIPILASKFIKEETRCLDASRIKEHQPMTAEVLRIMQVSGGNVTTKRVLLCR